MRNKLKIVFVFSLAITAFMLLSCNNLEDEAVTPANMKKLFRPSNFTIDKVISNVMTFKWTPISGANYELQLSLNESFSDNLQLIPIPHEVEGSDYETTSWDVDGLVSNVRYYARIRSVSMSGELETSGWSAVVSENTKQENIFYDPSSKDIGIDFINVSWDSTRVTFQIDVQMKGPNPDSEPTVVGQYPLTENEIKSGKKSFTGLLSNTTCIFTIYGRIYGIPLVRGTKEITTNTENIFKPVSLADVERFCVWLSWDDTKNPDKMVASASGKSDVTFNISADDGMRKEYCGLSAETNYTISIYTGTTVRGTVNFRTTTDYSINNILLIPEAEDIGETNITLKWNTAAFDVTHIIVSSSISGEADFKVDLTEDDISTHQKLIEGLRSNVSYTFRIYNNDYPRGEIDVKTD
jgi:hypothetical protein